MLHESSDPRVALPHYYRDSDTVFVVSSILVAGSNIVSKLQHRCPASSKRANQQPPKAGRPR